MATALRKFTDALAMAFYRGSADSDGWVQVKRGGLKFRVNPANYLDRQILLRGAFEPKTTELVRKFVKPGMKILDVGANFGYFSTIMASLIGPTGKIWAFEPVASFRKRLTDHLAANCLADRVNVHDFGLSDAEKELTITMEESTASLHPTSVGGATEKISLRRLDDVAEKIGIDGIDFVKIDIDGHEPHFLAGAEKTLTKFRPAMVMEFNQASLDVAGSDVRVLKDKLEAMGYELHSEKTGKAFESRIEFLRECGNFKRSANVWLFPKK